MINDNKFDINTTEEWDSNVAKFHYQLVFELWLYDVSSDSFQLNDRFVSLQLNLIRSD